MEDLSESGGLFSRERHAILVEIIDRLAWNQEPTDLLKELADPLLTVTGNDLLSLSIHNPDRNTMHTTYWKKNQESGEFPPFAVEEDPNGWAWKRQERVTIPDVLNEPRFDSWASMAIEPDIRCYTTLPMSTPSQHYGALGLGKNTPNVHAEEDVQFLSRIALLAAWAQSKEQMSRQQEEQRSLLTISCDVTCVLDLVELFRKILSSLRSIERYSSAGMTLLDDEGKSLLSYRGEGLLTTVLLAGPIPVEQAVSSRALQTKSALILNGHDLSKMTTPGAQVMYESGVRSICCLPIMVRDRIWGTLDLPSSLENAFSAKDAEYLQQVANQIANALQNASRDREIAKLRGRLGQQTRISQNEIPAETRNNMVGSSAALRKVLDEASTVADTDAPVLITGETGTGKELLARAIHAMSGRKDRSFIKVNCAAIPSGLLESELFGHEKGAFTGAINQKKGRLEVADKGTLFLDEIGEVPPDSQPKLLRVLEDYEFERLGSTRTIRVDVRLIAATNVNLLRAVQEKRFRGDLFYRLQVCPLHMPALRDRREDISPLVRHFVEKFATTMQKQIDVIPGETMEAILAWDWPGNIRELENFIERSVISSPANTLIAPLSELRGQRDRSETSSDSTLAEVRRDRIIEVLRECGGLISGPTGAAARLGLKRTTLQSMMEKLGISRKDYLT